MKQLILATILLSLGVLLGSSAVAQIAEFTPKPFAVETITSAEEVNLIRRREDPATGGGTHLVGSWKADITFNLGSGSPVTYRSGFFAFPRYFYAHLAGGVQSFYSIGFSGGEIYFSDIAVSDEYVYLLGSFSDELSVQDAEGRYFATIRSLGDTDLFLIQLDKEGNLVSTNRLGSEGRDFGDQLALDSDGNLLVAGRFSGTTNFLFDPDDNWISNTTSEGSDLFVAKYSPELGDGSILDLTILGGPDDQVKVTGLLVDGEDNVYVGGRFTKAIRVREAIFSGTRGEQQTTTAGSKQLFFTKLNAALAPRWLTVLAGDQEFDSDGDLDYDRSTQQLLAVQDVSSEPTYHGQALGKSPQSRDAYVLRINGTNGNLINHFLIGSPEYEDGKQIVSDQQGNYFLSGTFQSNLTISQGGTSRILARTGTKNTFLAAFSSGGDSRADDRLVYLSAFTNEANLYASRGMSVANFGGNLTATIPFVYDQEAFGLDGASLRTNTSGSYDIFIGSYDFPSIPRITEVAPVLTNNRYRLRIRGTRLFSSSENDFAYRIGEGAQAREGSTGGTITSGNETNEVLLDVPDTWVAGTTYPLILDKSFYTGFYQGTVSVPPVVTTLPGDASGTCVETLSLAGRYFGSASAGVKVFFDRDATEVRSATVSAVAPTQIQLAVPGVYPETYQVRVQVNGQEAPAGSYRVLPAITQLSEATVLPGATITVRGCAFVDATHGSSLLAVRLQPVGQEPIAITAFTVAPAQPDQLNLTLPDPLPVGTYTVEVSVNGQVAAGDLTLEVIGANTTQPLITALAPDGEASPGETVTITGKNLGSDPKQITVEIIEGQPITVSAVNETGTEITFTVPSDLPVGTYPKIIVKLGTKQAIGTLSLLVVPAVTPTEGLVVTPVADNPTAYDPTTNPLTLRTNVAGATDTDLVQLIITGLASAAPQEVATQLQEGSYQASVAEDLLTDPLGFEYRFVVKRGTTTRGASDPVRVYRQYPEQPMTLHKPDRAVPEQADYQLVAVPFRTQNVRDAWTGPRAFSADSIRLLRHAPGSDGYQEYRSEFQQFEPGRGYWLVKRAGVPLTVQGTAVEVDSGRRFAIPLQAGWNLIGNPFPFAIGLGWLGERDQRVFRSDRYTEPDGTLKPYEGLFVESEEATTLLVSAVDASNGRSGTGTLGISQYSNRPLDEDAWFVGFTVSNGSVTNQLAGFGMHPQAKVDQDPYDAQPLPRFKHFVEVQFSNVLNSRILERNVVPTTTQYKWQFAIETDPSSEEVHLQWDNREWGRNNRELWLRDEATQQLINLREVTSYSFRPNQLKRTFTLFYGPGDALSDHLLPQQVQVGALYPNPASRTVSLPITIPSAFGITPVQWVITDALGRTVCRWHQSLAPGFHTLNKDLREDDHRLLPPGMYSYRVLVGKDQSPFVGKIIVQ